MTQEKENWEEDLENILPGLHEAFRERHSEWIKRFISQLLTTERQQAYAKVREVIFSKKKILWNDDVIQHNRNLERENVLNDLLKEIERLAKEQTYGTKIQGDS